MLQLIINQYESVREQTVRFIDEERWNACHILFERYLHDLQPYCQARFLDELKTLYMTMKSAQDNEIKALCAKRFMNTVQNGLAEAKRDILGAKETTEQVHNIDLDKA